MRPIAIDVARSVVCVVCLPVSVGHTGEPCQTAEPIEVPLGADSWNHVLDGHAHWRIMANTTERSWRGVDADMC